MTSLAESGSSWLASGGRWRKPAILAALIALADWLFFGHPVGISVLVFLPALAVALVAASDRPGEVLRRLPAAAAILLTAAVPVAIDPTPLAVGLCLLAMAHFALAAAGRAGGRLADRMAGSAELLLETAWRWIYDLLDRIDRRGKAKAAAAASPGQPARPGAWAAWIVPLVLGLTFLLLFRSANPVIEGWLDAIDLGAWAGGISPQRVAFWLVAVVAVWPFLSLLRHGGPAPLAAMLQGLGALPRSLWTEPGRADQEAAGGDRARALFGATAIRRSLILFNLMFAVQTAMDLAYLWGGLALPEGMGYAAYAHRGAYPLIATALLAAVFVLAAMRPGSATAGSKEIRALVYLWIGQNVLLVISSMLRLDLYVAVYSLTYLRLAAFIWMLLVAVGLVLIVARIAFACSNAWLLGANLAALLLTLYFCAFVNLPALIAGYNVEHSREVSGEGEPLDLDYLLSLGPQALPALDRLVEHRGTTWWRLYASRRGQLLELHAADSDDWRAWSYRKLQLDSYLGEHRPPPAP